MNEDEPYFAEALSTIAMGVTATWTVSAGAQRALSMKQVLLNSGEAQPTIDESSAMMLPVISSVTLLVMYFLFAYIQSFLVLYMVVASFGATSMCLFDPVVLCWPKVCRAAVRVTAPCRRVLTRRRRHPALCLSLPFLAGNSSSSSSSSSSSWGARGFLSGLAARCTSSVSSVLGGGAAIASSGSAVTASGDSSSSSSSSHALTQSGATTVSALLAASLVGTWLLTGHWLALDCLGVSITVSVVSLIRLPSLKVAAIALVSLFFYDIFWVFFSASIFEENVMVAVATRKADNPAQKLAAKMNMDASHSIVETLQLPIKLMFPAGTRHGAQTFHMLGLGDMAIPGLFLAFALSFDAYLEKVEREKNGKLARVDRWCEAEEAAAAAAAGGAGGGGNGEGAEASTKEEGQHVRSDGGDAAAPLSSKLSPPAAPVAESSPPPAPPSPSSSSVLLSAMAEPPPPDDDEHSATLTALPTKRVYFESARCGYVLGIALSITASRVFGAAQPALLYLVPCVLLPMLWQSRGKRTTKRGKRLTATRKAEKEDGDDDGEDELSHLALLWAGFENDDDDGSNGGDEKDDGHGKDSGSENDEEGGRCGGGGQGASDEAGSVSVLLV